MWLVEILQEMYGFQTWLNPPDSCIIPLPPRVTDPVNCVPIGIGKVTPIKIFSVLASFMM